MMTSWAAHRTPKPGRAMKGRITHLSHGRFCGVIRATDGQNVFFHGRDLEGTKYNDVALGRSVSFELIADQVSGPRAARVRVAGAPSAASKKSPPRASARQVGPQGPVDPRVEIK